MADSIAKLAVVLTGDAAPLSAALQKSLQDVDRWALGMARASMQAQAAWNAGMANIRMTNLAGAGGPMEAFDPARLNRIPDSVKSFTTAFVNPLTQINTAAGKAARSLDGLATQVFKLNTLMSAFRGNFGAAFVVGGPAALGIAAITGGVFKLAAAGDQLLQKLGEDKLKTWAGQWERVNEQLGVMGLRFTMIARDASEGLANSLERINASLFPDSVAYIAALKQRKEAEKQILELRKQQEEKNKKQLQLNKEAAEAQQRERDALLDLSNAQRDRADQIRESVQTPAEQLKATFQELRSLLASGFLDEESAVRAAKAAQDRFNPRPNPADIQARPGVAATSRFTMAGFSAVQSGLREIDRRAEVKELERLNKEADKAGAQRAEIIQLLRGGGGGQNIEIVAGAP